MDDILDLLSGEEYLEDEQLFTDPILLQPAEDTWELEGIDVYALPPVTSGTGLKGLLLDVLGPYDTIITQYTYKQNGNNYYSYVNDISPDYPWLMSAALLIVLVFSVFRIAGGFLCKK